MIFINLIGCFLIIFLVFICFKLYFLIYRNEFFDINNIERFIKNRIHIFAWNKR